MDAAYLHHPHEDVAIKLVFSAAAEVTHRQETVGFGDCEDEKEILREYLMKITSCRAEKLHSKLFWHDINEEDKQEFDFFKKAKPLAP